MDWITIFEALNKIYNEGAYSNMAINDAIKNHDGCAPNFVRMFVKGVIRDTFKLEYFINVLAEKGVDSIKPRTKIIIMMGIYAIYAMNSVPDHAAVNESVKLAKSVAQGSDKFVNAILRAYLRNKDNIEIDDSNMMVKYSFPRKLVALLMAQYGDETEDILKALSSPAPLTVRANTIKNSPQDVIDYLKLNGINAFKSLEVENGLICENGNVIQTPGYNSGMFSVQGLSSIMAIERLHPEPYSTVLDMCAAPGGKTGAIAEMMGNNGKIVACDVHEHKLSVIDATMKRLGIDIVETMLMDGTKYNSKFDSVFDYVVADVPCSGLGVISSKPEIKIRTDVTKYDQLIETQKQILENAIKYAKLGGTIEYSTCTLNKNENDELIQDVLNKHNNLLVIEKKTIMPYNNMTGFYYCILRKTA